jgi:hypothetical protein
MPAGDSPLICATGDPREFYLETLASRRTTERSMYPVLMSHLRRLPGMMGETLSADGF